MFSLQFVKHVPNALSILRIVLAPTLPLVAWRSNAYAFVALYAFIALTDLADGQIARRFNATSMLGSKLDTTGDALFMFFAVVSMFVAGLEFYPFPIRWFIILLIPNIIYKLANLFVVRARFGHYNAMHTLLNRIMGGVFVFLPPLFILLGNVNFWIVVVVSVTMFLFSVEETITILRMEEYNPDHYGVVGSRLRKNKTR
ncbi:MAG: CDP-alcohol phosphatidyltransferase family protein [Oscillospiraceae bacterium]|nr:CDP-alcohol phosphatidyltransferase family protein [Oscillospiraceae bacterium]